MGLYFYSFYYCSYIQYSKTYSHIFIAIKKSYKYKAKHQLAHWPSRYEPILSVRDEPVPTLILTHARHFCSSVPIILLAIV